MQQWAYCEVGWTPKQVRIHIYSSRADGTSERKRTWEELRADARMVKMKEELAKRKQHLA